MSNHLITGVGGTIKFSGNTPYHIRKWTIRQTLDTVSLNTAKHAGVTLCLPVRSKWEGSCSIYLSSYKIDFPGTVVNPLALPAQFVGSTGHETESYHGYVFITGIDVDVNVEDAEVMSAEITFEGTLSLHFDNLIDDEHDRQWLLEI